jgi:hypothetical protein
MTKTNGTTATPLRVERNGHLRWVAIADVHIPPMAQRELRPGWAAQLAAEFDPDSFTPPLLSLRGSRFYVIDGQHRFEAMRLMGWEDQQVQCWVYEGLTEADEAEMFLRHNNRKAVGAFDKFRIAVAAGRPAEVDIDRTARLLGLRVSQDEGGISAVSALRKVYDTGQLPRTLRILRDAYGEPGLTSDLISGIGLLCARYNGDLDESVAVQKLAAVRQGAPALIQKAHLLRKQTGQTLNHCVAAAAVETINGGRGGKKLPSWWS